MIPAEVRRHFESSAAGYADLRGAGMLGALRRREERAVDAIGEVRAGERVLDVGCGDGSTLARVAANTRSVGVDASLGMARVCRERGLDVCVQDMAALGFRPHFDRVLCIGSLEFAPEPGAALRSMAACLRPGGSFALLYPRRAPLGLVYALYHRTHGVRIRLFSPAEIRSLLHDAGIPPTREISAGPLSSLVAARKPG